MSRRTPSRSPSRPLRVAAAVIAGLLAATLLSASGASADPAAERARSTTASTPTAAEAAAAKAAPTNPVTPGNFTGFGFDQCLAPTQAAMNTWLQHSPFLSAGIYISGDSRACRSQPNLTPRWISTQLRKGWRLLPITLGPQASCQPRFPRYSDDFKINPKPGKLGRYSLARKMGTAEATKAVAAAQGLGIVPGSTLWYDLEGFNHNDTHCRESALVFLSAWTNRLHELSYVSGVYSSAGSGIKMLDDARVTRPGVFTLPDMIWLARWDGIANTSSSYLRNDGWQPGGRVKQYMGGHDEVWGGVRINIDRNYLRTGKGSIAAAESRCGGTPIGFGKYQTLRPPTSAKKSPADQVKAAQCLLKEQGLYAGPLDGAYSPGTVAAARAWQARTKAPASDRWTKQNWMSIFATGDRPVLKFGSAGQAVRRVQRALNAASGKSKLSTSGVFDTATTIALRAYQAKVKIPVSGVASSRTWKAFLAGLR